MRDASYRHLMHEVFLCWSLFTAPGFARQLHKNVIKATHYFNMRQVLLYFKAYWYFPMARQRPPHAMLGDICLPAAIAAIEQPPKWAALWRRSPPHLRCHDFRRRLQVQIPRRHLLQFTPMRLSAFDRLMLAAPLSMKCSWRYIPRRRLWWC